MKLTTEQIAATVAELLLDHGLTLAVAESCTGGRISAAITAVPGVSGCMVGGVVAYSNRIKHELLGVSLADIEEVGAVSEVVAGQMAAGARRLFQTDFAVATSGLAGPGGGTEHKPVGLFFVALASVDGIRVSRFVFTGNRTENQNLATREALRILLETINNTQNMNP